VAHIDGDPGLTNGKVKVGVFNQAEWQAMLTHIAEERGYKPGWVAHKFKEKFGHWPDLPYRWPIEPSREVLSWVRSRAIAYAKRRAVA
jgi:hypothetical protein